MVNAPKKVVHAAAIKVLSEAGYEVLYTYKSKRKIKIVTEEARIPKKRDFIDRLTVGVSYYYLSWDLYITEKKAKNITSLELWLMTRDPSGGGYGPSVDIIYWKQQASLLKKIKELAEKEAGKTGKTK